MPDDKNAKTVHVQGVDLEAYLASACSIDPNDLQSEYIQLPADMAYWNERYAIAYRNVQQVKIKMEELEALIYLQYREELTESGVKYTEALLDAKVKADPRYVAIRQSYVDADVERIRHNGAVGAIDAKKEMLISLGATQRKELATLTGLTVKVPT